MWSVPFPRQKICRSSTDIVEMIGNAKILGVSHQNMRKLMLTYTGSFPKPIYEDNISIWYLAECGLTFNNQTLLEAIGNVSPCE